MSNLSCACLLLSEAVTYVKPFMSMSIPLAVTIEVLSMGWIVRQYSCAKSASIRECVEPVSGVAYTENGSPDCRPSQSRTVGVERMLGLVSSTMLALCLLCFELWPCWPLPLLPFSFFLLHFAML